MKKFLIPVLTSFLFSIAAETQSNLNLPIYQYKLKAGSGKELVEMYCQMCHSVGYILNNAGADKKTWEHIVHHMINDFKAPIKEETAEKIIEYLSKKYGKVENK